jgi:hypothetical protein
MNITTLSLIDLTKLFLSVQEELALRLQTATLQEPQPESKATMEFTDIKQLAQRLKKKQNPPPEPKPLSEKLKLKRRLLPPHIITALNEGYAPDTVESTLNSIIRVSKLAFGTDFFDYDEYINFPKVVIVKLIVDVKKDSIKRTLLGGVLRVLKLMGATKEQLEPYDDRMIAWQEAGPVPPTEKEIANRIPLAEVELKRQELKALALQHNTSDHWHEYLLISLQLDIPPQRPRALAMSQIVHYPVVSKSALEEKATSDCPNFICLNNKKLVLTKYKTDAQGATSFDLPDKLCEIISNCHTQHGFKYLIPLKTNMEKPMDASSVWKQLDRILGKHMCSNMFRKVTISEQTPNQSNEEKNKMAKAMCHSTSTHFLTYNKDELLNVK